MTITDVYWHKDERFCLHGWHKLRSIQLHSSLRQLILTSLESLYRRSLSSHIHTVTHTSLELSQEVIHICFPNFATCELPLLRCYLGSYYYRRHSKVVFVAVAVGIWFPRGRFLPPYFHRPTEVIIEFLPLCVLRPNNHPWFCPLLLFGPLIKPQAVKSTWRLKALFYNNVIIICATWALYTLSENTFLKFLFLFFSNFESTFFLAYNWITVGKTVVEDVSNLCVARRKIRHQTWCIFQHSRSKWKEKLLSQQSAYFAPTKLWSLNTSKGKWERRCENWSLFLIPSL